MPVLDIESPEIVRWNGQPYIVATFSENLGVGATLRLAIWQRDTPQDAWVRRCLAVIEGPRLARRCLAASHVREDEPPTREYRALALTNAQGPATGSVSAGLRAGEVRGDGLGEPFD